MEILKRGFKNIEQEIDFFKNHKHLPQSQLIYYLQLRSLELEFPNDSKSRRRHLVKKIAKINKFFSSHSEFGKYMELGHQHLDRFYFTRSYLNENEVLLPQNYQLDLQFNTSHDMLLSKYIAFKKLLPLFNREVSKPKLTQDLTKRVNLEWTSSKVALIELIYALQINGSINQGKMEIITIATVFEDLFNIKLDNIYKTYSEIKLRKGSRTKFLDELIWQFEQKLKADDSL